MIHRQHSQEQDSEADPGVNQGGKQVHKGQNFQRKDHFLDVVGVLENKGGGARHHLGEQGKEDQARERIQGKADDRVALSASPSGTLGARP